MTNLLRVTVLTKFDQKTINVFFFIVAFVTLAGAFAAEPKCKPCITTLEYMPVCGSNDVTYPNPSAFKCAQKCFKDNDCKFFLNFNIYLEVIKQVIKMAED